MPKGLKFGYYRKSLSIRTERPQRPLIIVELFAMPAGLNLSIERELNSFALTGSQPSASHDKWRA